MVRVDPNHMDALLEEPGAAEFEMGNRGPMKGWLRVDADVFVPAETANMLSPDSGPDSAAATSDARFGTTATKVDVISARFGASKIHVTAETVLGVAVLSLADLKRFKQADADSAVAATAHKATADLLIIDRLIALKNKDA